MSDLEGAGRRNLFDDETTRKIEERRQLTERGLKPATIHAGTEPQVTRREELFDFPPPSIEPEWFGTDEQWVEYMRHVRNAPAWASVVVEMDTGTMRRRGTFVWWEIETWIEREDRRA